MAQLDSNHSFQAYSPYLFILCPTDIKNLLNLGLHRTSVAIILYILAMFSLQKHISKTCVSNFGKF